MITHREQLVSFFNALLREFDARSQDEDFVSPCYARIQSMEQLAANPYGMTVELTIKEVTKFVRYALDRELTRLEFTGLMCLLTHNDYQLGCHEHWLREYRMAAVEDESVGQRYDDEFDSTFQSRFAHRN